MRTDTIYHVNYWIKKGFTIDESKEKVEASKKETSWRCKEFWIKRGYTEQNAILKISQKQSEIALTRDKSVKRSDPYNREYYIKKNIIDPDQINELIQKRKNKSNPYLKWSKDELKTIIDKRNETYYNKLPIEREKINKKRGRTKQQLIEKYGEDYVNIIFHNRGNANRSRFGHGVSKISIELFDYLSDLNKDKKFMYGNEEKYILIKNIKKRNGYFVDFYYEKDKKIIEFNGDFWHFNPNKYSSEDYCIMNENKIIAKNIWKEDNMKIDNLLKNGYSVLVIWENEYLKNKNSMVKKCDEFINQQ